MTHHDGHRGRILLMLVFFSSHIWLVGCNDESRTTGTMIQISEAEKTRLKEKKETYKGGPPKNRAKVATKPRR